MNISVRYEPTCTWELDGDSFYCTHDITEVVDFTELYMTIDGAEERTGIGYECVECGEPVEGSPEEAREEVREMD